MAILRRLRHWVLVLLPLLPHLWVPFWDQHFKTVESFKLYYFSTCLCLKLVEIAVIEA